MFPLKMLGGLRRDLKICARLYDKSITRTRLRGQRLHLRKSRKIGFIRGGNCMRVQNFDPIRNSSFKRFENLFVSGLHRQPLTGTTHLHLHPPTPLPFPPPPTPHPHKSKSLFGGFDFVSCSFPRLTSPSPSPSSCFE